MYLLIVAMFFFLNIIEIVCGGLIVFIIKDHELKDKSLMLLKSVRRSLGLSTTASSNIPSDSQNSLEKVHFHEKNASFRPILGPDTCEFC